MSGAQVPAVLRRSEALHFSEHAAEVLGILESETVGHLGDGLSGGQSVLGQADNKPTDVAARRLPGCLFDDIAEIVGRHAQPIGTVLHGGQSELQLKLLVEIVAEQAVEADENVWWLTDLFRGG